MYFNCPLQIFLLQSVSHLSCITFYYVQPCFLSIVSIMWVQYNHVTHKERICEHGRSKYNIISNIVLLSAFQAFKAHCCRYNLPSFIYSWVSVFSYLLQVLLGPCLCCLFIFALVCPLVLFLPCTVYEFSLITLFCSFCMPLPL